MESFDSEEHDESSSDLVDQRSGKQIDATDQRPCVVRENNIVESSGGQCPNYSPNSADLYNQYESNDDVDEEGGYGCTKRYIGSADSFKCAAEVTNMDMNDPRQCQSN